MNIENTFLILAYCHVRNRQGFDLNEMLNSRNLCSRLIQVGAEDDPKKEVIGIPMSPDLSGWRLRIMSRLARWQMFLKGCKNKNNITVAINTPALLPAVFLKLLFKSKLVFYSLEYHVLKPANRILLKYFCDAIIDVEETRCELLQAQIGKALPSIIFHNVPNFVELNHLDPKLRKWLVQNKQFIGNEFLITYSGSYQKYCNLESILEWAEDLPDQAWLVVMLTEIPDHINSKKYEKTIFITSKRHNDLYNWLVDADVSLLPYEAEDDNVRYCSPQKIFDALACGVPVLGSRRPLIEQVVRKYQCGITIDFHEKKEFLKGVEWFIAQSRAVMRQKARAAHGEYNYGNYSRRLLELFRDLGRGADEAAK